MLPYSQNGSHMQNYGMIGVRNTFRTARRSQGLLSLADQGIVSVGSFLVALLMARGLPPAEFGVFSILLGILITANTAHASFIGIPLIVRSGRDEMAEQLSTVALGWSFLLTALFTMALVVALLILARPGLLPWTVLALFGNQLQETLRRSLMGRLQFGRAIYGDSVSYFGQAIGVFWLVLRGRPSISGAFVAMGTTSLAAAGVQWCQVRPSTDLRSLSREIVEPFWRLGRALIVINGIGSLTMQCFPWLLAAMHGVAEVGSFQALLTMIGFVNPLMLAMGSIVTARVAHIKQEDPGVRRHLEFDLARRYAVLGGVPLALYSAALVAAPTFILREFYGRTSMYGLLSQDVRIFVFFAVAQYGYFVMAGILNARQDTRSLLRAQIASAVTVPLIALPLIAFGSLTGALLGISISAAVRLAVAVRGVAGPVS